MRILHVMVVFLIIGLSLSFFPVPSSAKEKNFDRNQQKSFDFSNSLTWNLDVINVQGAWEITNGSSNIIVAEIDILSLMREWKEKMKISNRALFKGANLIEWFFS